MANSIEYPAFSAGAVIDSNLYFSDNYTNSLFELNLDKWIMRQLQEFPNEEKHELLHSKAYAVGDKVVFIPQLGDCFQIFETKCQRLISVKFTKKVDSRYSVNDSVLVDDCIYVFPGDGVNEVVKLDINTLQVEKLGTIAYGAYEGKGTNCIFYKVAYKDGKVYMAEMKSAFLVVYDLKSRNWQKLDTGMKSLYTVSCVRDKLLINSLDGKMYEWDEAGNEMTELINDLALYKSCWNVFESAGNIMLASEEGGDVFVLDEAKREFISCARINYTNSNRLGSVYKTIFNANETVLTLPYGAKQIFVTKESTIQEQELQFPEDEEYTSKRIAAARDKLSTERVLNENIDISFETFIEIVKGTGQRDSES